MVKEYVHVIRDLYDNFAKPLGVKLALEMVGFGWSPVRTPRGSHQIVRQVDREGVGMVFDTMHVYGGGGLLNEFDVMDPSQIYSIHINDVEDVPKEAITDAKRLIPGEGVIPLDDICRHLKAIGYDGWCTIELFREEYYQWEPNVLAEKSREATLSILEKYFTVE